MLVLKNLPRSVIIPYYYVHVIFIVPILCTCTIHVLVYHSTAILVAPIIDYIFPYAPILP